MKLNNSIISSESVTIGHPDKVCDCVADSILDEYLKGDPSSHVACEVTAVGNKLHIFGEVSSRAKVDCASVARATIKKIGYDREELGFSDNCEISLDLRLQSPEINAAVSKSNADIGAGDQGFMFGYACSDTSNFMPLGIELAHNLSRHLTKLRQDGTLSYLRPDGKTQVSLKYNDRAEVEAVDTVVVSTQTDEDVSLKQIKVDIEKHLIRAQIDERLLKNTKFLINPSGRFTIGGPAGDSGLTGRKLMVDTYGPYSHHGGGSFAGKDATKVDRSATYMLRRIAKNLVFHKLCDRVEIQVAYSIGVSEPVSLAVDTFGTGKYNDAVILDKIKKFYSLKPRDIIEFLELTKPNFAVTNNSGVFGNPSFSATWEKIDEDF